MKTAYFDCFSGAGGDMIVGSLIDAGADPDALRTDLAALGLDGYALFIERVNKQGFAATRFQVELTAQEEQPHRHLKHIVDILQGSRLPDVVKRHARRIFERLAQAEAKVHGSTVEKVHFHEVGAVDAILDITGAVLALERLGIERVVCSPIPTGSGTVTCEHGVMPVPAPATAELLVGVPLAACDDVCEMTTPTAAAVLTTLADEFGSLPAMTIDSIGYGAGSREGGSRPNLLRVFIGETPGEGDVDEITVLETNLDDASPELVAHCMEQVLGAGALDVYAVPIVMKKSRAAVTVTVLCANQDADALERIIFAETTTFGVRRHRVRRAKMRRRHETVRTAFGDVRIKVGERDGVETASPEYEDCKSVADREGIALRRVVEAAVAAWAARERP